MVTDDKAASAGTECSIAQCDIFDFMANHVGLTVIHPGGIEATKRLLDSSHIDRDSRVLDIGCGKGTTSVFLAKRYGCKVVGVDLSEDLLEQSNALAKKKGVSDRVSFRLGNALSLPFADGEFDATIGQAILILVGDKKKAIREALRVTRTGGHVGWLELSWWKPVTKEFLDGVSNVICAYCMLGVETFEDWRKILDDAGVKDLQVSSYSQGFGGISSMLPNEGFANTITIALRYVTNSEIRKRMKTTDRFFKDNGQYFGYGIYVGKK